MVSRGADDGRDWILAQWSIEELREDIWLEEVYGAQSRLANDAWLTKVSDKKASWIFEPKALRTKLFEMAKISPRH